MNAARCPRCNARVPVRLLEGIRTPALSRSMAFDCPHCQARLVINYWDVKAYVFRVLFVLGAIALAIAVSWLGVGIGTFVPVFAAYVVLGWVVLLQLRKVVYADNRYNEALRQGRQA
jgi:hypothetical protein